MLMRKKKKLLITISVSMYISNQEKGDEVVEEKQTSLTPKDVDSSHMDCMGILTIVIDINGLNRSQNRSDCK